MPKPKVYLDDQGNPISGKVYLDSSGNPMLSPSMDDDAARKLGIQGPSGSDPISRFAKGVWDYTGAAVPELAKTGWALARAATASPLDPTATRPLSDIVSGIIGQSRAKAAEAGQRFGEGDYRGGIRAGVEAVPFAGPMATDLAEDVTQGDFARLAGKATALMVPGAVQRKLGKVELTNFRNPTEQAGIREAAARGVPVDMLQATGNPVSGALRQLASRLPGFASRDKQFLLAQREKLNAVVRELSATPEYRLVNPDELRTPGAVPSFNPQPRVGDPFAVGAGMKRAGASRAAEYMGEVDTAADALREMARAKPSEHVTGWKAEPVPGEFDPATGVPRTLPTPITRTVYGAVDFAPVKAGIKSTVEMIRAELGANAAERMPALRALEQILEREGPVDLAVALDDASQINKKARATDPQLRDKSQGLAAHAVPLIYDAIDKAVVGLGPEAQAAWKIYRDSTKKKYAVKALAERAGFKPGMADMPGREVEIAVKLGDEPRTVTRRLFAPGDQNAMTAEAVAKEFPQFIPKLREAWTASVLDDAMRTGNWDDAMKAIAELGPRTRMTFGIDQSFEEFFRFTHDQNQVLTRAAALRTNGKEFLRTAYDGINAGADTATASWERFYRLDPAMRWEMFGQLEEPVRAMLQRMAQNETSATLLEQFAENRTTGGGVRSKIKVMPPNRSEALLGSNAGTLQRLSDFAVMIDQMPNPSNTSAVLSLLEGGGFMLRHPLQSAAYILGGRQLARIIHYGGDGASLLNEAVRLPLGNPNAGKISKSILTLAGIDAQENLDRSR